MIFPYIIIDDDQESVMKTKAIADGFSELVFVTSANNYADGLNLVLTHTPKIVFLEIDPSDKASNLSLAFINELYRYLKIVPKIIITTSKKDLAFDAIQYEVADYLLKPIAPIDLVKTLLKLKKANLDPEIKVDKKPIQLNNQQDFLEEENYLAVKPMLEEHQKPEIETKEVPFLTKQISNPEKPLIICIKSYGDYRYIDAKDICFFQADNNSTDIHLNNGDMITAFKTLKHFEAVLSFPFVRIHNSYILNCDYISRIHTGNAVCHIKNSTAKLPFSKSYKVNIDFIISNFSKGNFLEI